MSETQTREREERDVREKREKRERGRKQRSRGAGVRGVRRSADQGGGRGEEPHALVRDEERLGDGGGRVRGHILR